MRCVRDHPLPAHVIAALARLARGVAATPSPDRRSRRTVVVGRPGPAAVSALATALGGDVSAVPAPDSAALDLGGIDVLVALDWLHRLPDPAACIRALHGTGATDLLIGAPREPFARLGVGLATPVLAAVGAAGRTAPGRTSWSAPGFIRLASTIGPVRMVAHPIGWSLAWVRPD